MSAATIARSELFPRLAEGRAAGIAVVTPNRRLAQALAREFDAFQAANGLRVWEDADVLPFGAFVERLWEDALYSQAATDLPLLLSAAQEETLWAAAIRASEWGEALLGAERTAAEAASAWRLAHAWRLVDAIGNYPGNEDAHAFAVWSREYRRRTAAQTDAARLPDRVAGLLHEPALKKPKRLVAYGFDLVPPQTQEFFAACEANGIEVAACQPLRREAKPLRRSFDSPRSELEAAARWARARLTAGVERIGVVVPELKPRRKEVLRVFSRVLAPGFNLPGAPRAALPFNVSLGAPLADTPIVHAALSILRLAAGEVDFALASRLVRSPFIGEGESELSRRAQLDAHLRRKLPPRLTLAGLIGATGGCPLLRRRLEALFARAREIAPAERSPHDWATHCSALLEAAGFPGERALDSAEHQARAKLNELLGELARLERVAPRLERDAALERLRRLCEQALFQPETSDPPVQVLGILESAGLEFDCLWVSGLTDAAWPLAARPNPFLPVALQKRAGVPEASAESSLALDRRITEGWAGAAPEVIFSHPLREDDRELLPSPLIVPFALDLAVPPISSVPPRGTDETLRASAEREVTYPVESRRVSSGPEGPEESGEKLKYRDVIFAARRLESVPDGQAPAIVVKAVRGGTRILADQSACPFRAFARHRLGAETLEAPAEGPDALVRGQLLHGLMAKLWGELKSRANLLSLSQQALSATIGRAAAAAVVDSGLDGRFAELERARLERLAREWLEVECKREDFEVVAIEQPRALEIGSLALSGRIDRMDRLADGSHLLLDYKTSRQLSPRQWIGPRPEDPQLPLYAVGAKEEIGAVAFARLRHGEMRFMGYARASGVPPELTRYEDWGALLAGWKRELGSLAEGFAAGAAQVDPKKGFATCRNCGLQPLCRVHERFGALEADDEGG